MMNQQSKRTQDAQQKAERQRRLGDAMRAIMKRKGWRGERLARKLGVTPGTVTRYLNAEITMPAWVVSAFCDLLAVKPNEVFEPASQSGPDGARVQALNQAATLLQDLAAELEQGRVPEVRKRGQ